MNIDVQISSPVASRDSLVVRTSRCGRDNPGSNPGHGILFFFFLPPVQDAPPLNKTNNYQKSYCAHFNSLYQYKIKECSFFVYFFILFFLKEHALTNSRFHFLIGYVQRSHVKARIGNAIGPYEDLLTTVKRRKLKWYGHVTRSSGLAKTILQGTVEGGR